MISPTPTLDPAIANWQTYTDAKDGISFKYPNTWVYNTPPSSGPEGGLFKPMYATSEEMAGNSYVVTAILLVNNYQTDVQRIPIEGKYTQEATEIANLPGVHFIGAEDGYYILNNGGKAIEFRYIVTKGKDYSQTAQRMVESLVFLSK